MCTGGRERTRHSLHGSGHLLADGRERWLRRPHGDPIRTEGLRLGRHRSRQLQPPEIGMRVRGAGQHREQELQIGRRPRHGSAHRQIATGDVRRVAGRAEAGQDTERRLQSEDSAVGRGNADRSSDVGSQLERGQTGRQRGRRSARGAAGRARLVPRVVARAVERIVGLDVRAAEGHVALAEHDRSRTFQVLHQKVRGGGGRSVRARRVAVCRRESGDVVLLLHGEAQPVEGTPQRFFFSRHVRRSCTRARSLGIQHTYRAEPGVVLLDAGEQRL
mmetsp:Transcript_20398/g.40765  ORF Transcript_20398/g.40765 Transcript_20398/m.40765 type:complete len:275 (-) Transcript_20398:166-990(-)